MPRKPYFRAFDGWWYAQINQAGKRKQLKLIKGKDKEQETGCRPGEVARVTAADVNLELGVWILKRHKTAKKTGKPRIVYLMPSMIDLT